MKIRNRLVPQFLRVFFASIGLSTQVACTEAKAHKADRAMPAPTVYFASVARHDLPIFIETVGTLDGYVNADIRARVRGFLQTQNYKDGAYVKAGQALFTIEATEYAAALASANANLTRANVGVSKNKVELERDQGLFNTGMLSRQDLDNVTANVADTEGQVQGARAQVTQAQLNLSYTQLRSPISGIAGLALVRVGNLVGQDGPTLLTTVSQLDPIRVNFPISEVDYVRYPERFKHLESRDLDWAKKQFSKLASGKTAENGDPGIELVLSDGSTYAGRGVIVAANRQVDPSTGTLQVQALVPNPELVLRPGQYAHVRMKRQNEGKDALLVPEKALISVQGTYSVGVIGPGNKIKLHRVELGPSAQGQRVVISGISEGDRIVVEGVQKISDGAVVAPVLAPPTSTGAQPPSPPTK
jgi:membrane fusion protein, multidrug efflux system